MATARSMATKNTLEYEWSEPDKLLLLEGWARDNYSEKEIASKMGISSSELSVLKNKNEDIKKAIKSGKEVVDIKVENALLKSALGYRTREVKVTTTIRGGRIIETIKESSERDIAPSTAAIQFWLCNRLPDKWKRNRDNIINVDEEDTNIQVVVTRASQPKEKEEDKEWQEEINNDITIRRATEEEKEIKEKEKQKKKIKEKENKALENNPYLKVEKEASDEDLDYWPDDWNEDEE